jgi:hypothetical protein
MIVLVSRSGTNETRALEDESARLFADRFGADARLLPHIYHLPEDDPLWDELAAAEGPVLALAHLYPRPAEWVLRSHGVGTAGLSVFDIRRFGSAAECLEACSDKLPEPTGPGSVREHRQPAPARWYPVLDRSRCVNCGQCMQFCLFGVYERLDGRVEPVRPDNCKLGCPACARVCPKGAIMFPLYHEDEAVAGAPGCFPTPDPEILTLLKERTRGQPKAQADDGGEGEDEALDRLIDDLEQMAGTEQ